MTITMTKSLLETMASNNGYRRKNSLMVSYLIFKSIAPLHRQSDYITNDDDVIEVRKNNFLKFILPDRISNLNKNNLRQFYKETFNFRSKVLFL